MLLVFPFSRPETTGLELISEFLDTRRWKVKPGLKVCCARPLHKGVLALFDDMFGPTLLKAPSSPIWSVFFSCHLQNEVGEGTAMRGVLAVLSRG